MLHQSVGEAFQRGANNFNALRLIAALLVLFSHSWPLTGSGVDPLLGWLGGLADGGRLGIGVFFVISGFLVTRSALTRDPDAYVRARALRILPALAVAVLVQTFVIGLLCTELPWRVYLTHRQTLDWLRNATVFDLRPTLPYVFGYNPYPAIVNGSLWTLPVECGFYLALPLAALLGGLRRGVAVLLPAATGIAIAFAGASGLSWARQGPFLLWDVPLFPALDCLILFLVGAALWVHRDEVPLSGGLALICLTSLFASAGSAGAGIVFHLALPYLVIYAALARPCTERLLRPIGDLSYGTYLYAFPVQQALIFAGAGQGGPFALTLLATPIALGCGALSWRLVERPALRLKGARRRRRVAA